MSRQVTAKNAVPGRRYLTAKNVLLQAVRGQDGRLEVVKNAEGEFAVFNRVTDAGVVDPKRHLVFLGYSSLTPAFENRPGRPRHEDRTWSGWAQKFPELPNSLLEVAAGTPDFYRLDRTHYMLLGRRGLNHFAVFRSGYLGIKDEKMIKALTEGGFEPEVRDERFYPRRINLAAVAIAHQGPEFLKLFGDLAAGCP